MVGRAVLAGVPGNRYQDFVAFPDGSVAFVARGTAASKARVLRVLPCGAG